MVGGRFDCARFRSAVIGSRGRTVVRRKDQDLLLDADPNARSAATETQEKQPDAVAAPKRCTQIDYPPQTQIISNARPGRGRNTQGKTQKTFSHAFAQPGRDAHPDARGIACTTSGRTFALAQPGEESRNRLA